MSRSNRKRVLVVERHEASRRGLVALLEAEDVVVRSCADARQALVLARTEPFDALVLDLEVPADRVADLRAIVAARPDARLVWTSCDHPTFDLGAGTLVVKPIAIDTLLQHLGVVPR
ncbi:MAG: response regulator [Labilithrix sp.]|nr:response regulator [Labilithrix sp.]MCW5812634.1 response regulator [Labilithrix sp.]